MPSKRRPGQSMNWKFVLVLAVVFMSIGSYATVLSSVVVADTPAHVAHTAENSVNAHEIDEHATHHHVASKLERPSDGRTDTLLGSTVLVLVVIGAGAYIVFTGGVGAVVPLAQNGASRSNIVTRRMQRRRTYHADAVVAPVSTTDSDRQDSRSNSTSGGAASSDRFEGRSSPSAVSASSSTQSSKSQSSPTQSQSSDGRTNHMERSVLTNAERVSELLRTHGRMRQCEIAAELDWSASKTSRTLSRMADDGAVAKLRIGRENVIDLRDGDSDAHGDFDV